MGVVSRFVCPGCGYEAEVSGGPDGGMAVDTLTISCSDCRELYDVVVGEHRPAEQPLNHAPACPNSPDHAWKPWIDPGPCPRCAVAMELDEAILFWD